MKRAGVYLTAPALFMPPEFPRIGLSGSSVADNGMKKAEALRTPALATTLRRGLIKTEYLYVKLPCPSAHTSYSKVQFQHYLITLVF